MKEEAFVEAILASPGDQSLRLVYADWLEERGDSRGQLLRVLHAMTQAPVCSAQYRKLRYRREELRKGCDPGWLKIMLRLSFPQMRRKVEELQRLDKAREVFASDRHQYRLNPPLDVKRIKEIEARLGCQLPEQYRRFITEFADGGAGPDHGIIPLESLLQTRNDPKSLESLATPFPVPVTEEDLHELGYCASEALPVCQIGCGGFYQLIVSGPERGHVWVQNPDAQWSPELLDESHLPAGPGVSIDAYLLAASKSPPSLKLEFVDWYLRWLDEALWKVSSSQTPLEDLFDLDPQTTKLSITARKLTTLPQTLRTVTALRFLNLHGNRLTRLPDWIGGFSNLEHLAVGGNPLRALPESIGKLSRLKRLHCSFTEALQKLPNDIGRLSELEVLDLSYNRLKALPPSIGKLARLRELDLCTNQLTSLPNTMGRLRQLRCLKLDWNKLSQLPSGMGNLVQLEELELRANRFCTLPPCISRMPALHTLRLGENPKLDVRDACRKLARVSTLRHLSLFMNEITELPDEIGLLTQLRRLDLSLNRLTTLPAALARLTNLEELTLDSNPNSASLRKQRRTLLPHLD